MLPIWAIDIDEVYDIRGGKQRSHDLHGAKRAVEKGIVTRSCSKDTFF
jgi:hypothetical protein